ESDSLQTMILNAKLSFFSGFTRRFPIDPFGSWKVVSESLIVLGSILILWGLISLRKSFSIMAEAREFIRHGPYRWIRHPVYLGESLATLGWFILQPSAFSLFFAVLFIVCQRVRAHFEERKLQSVFPEYATYRKRTGAYWPFTNKTVI